MRDQVVIEIVLQSRIAVPSFASPGKNLHTGRSIFRSIPNVYASDGTQCAVEERLVAVHCWSDLAEVVSIVPGIE